MGATGVDLKAEAYLKVVCIEKGCGHTRGWHFNFILPSNIGFEYLRTLPTGPCRHPNCRCRGFKT